MGLQGQPEVFFGLLEEVFACFHGEEVDVGQLAIGFEGVFEASYGVFESYIEHCDDESIEEGVGGSWVDFEFFVGIGEGLEFLFFRELFWGVFMGDEVCV